MPDMHFVAGREGWLEQAGEVELIGGWAEIALDADFAACVDTSSYQVFATSYDAIAVFVTNRSASGFEIHALPMGGRRPSTSRCAYRVIGRRRTSPEG
jgi:hypothetical protein